MDLDFWGVPEDSSTTNRAAVVRSSEKQLGGFKKYFSLEDGGIK